jgi:hypothetical protein
MNGAYRLAVCLALVGLVLAARAAPPANPGREEVARMAFNVKVARDLNRGDVQAALGMWAEELSGKFDVPAETLFYEDMASLRRDFDKGKVNFVIAAGMDFARYFRPEELAEGFRGALQSDHSLLLLARRDAGVADLGGLAGKRVALLKDDELSDIYLETVCLRHYKRPCKQVFGNIEAVANSNQLILRLVFGKADLVLSRRSGYETAREMNPQIGRVALELTQFPLKSSYYGFYGRDVPRAFRARSLRHAPEMHKEVRGRQVLEVFRMDRLELVGGEELRPFYDLLAEYESLRAGLAPRRGAR